MNFFGKSFIKVSLFSVALTALTSAFLPIHAQAARPDALKLYKSGNYKEAIRVCQEELNDPSRGTAQDIESYVVLCWSLVANKQYREAEKSAAQARQLSSYDARLLEIQAESKFYLEKYDEAMTLLQQYVVIPNADKKGSQRIGLSYYLMGEIYIRQKKWEHADIAISKAVDTEPGMSFWWSKLGYAREQAGYYQDAILAYNKAISLNASSSDDARRGLVRCQAKLNP
ncbi:MAG: tetratricopeptide repeat protein [Treponema sp.]|nr:tetratricopeptide repeat protein [Treponema sp.]